MSQTSPQGGPDADIDLDAPVFIDPDGVVGSAPVPDEEDDSADDLESEAAAAVDGDVIDPADVDVEVLITELESVAKERDELREQLVRSAADFDNFRKRSARDQADAGKAALGRFVDSLLPALDACDAAMAQGDAGAESIARLLLDALGKQGLTAVGEAGEPFDPAVHEAVMVEAGEGGEQVVLDVLRRGYRWEDRVLRAAMVKVSG